MTPIKSPVPQAAVAAPVMDAVQSASARTGIDFDYLVDVARVESRFNPTAQAPTSSARGLFQFTRQTWLATLDRHGASHGLGWAADAIGRDASGRLSVVDPVLRERILALRDDPAASSAMAAALTADNRTELESRFGRPMEPVDLYLAHFLGSGGAKRFLAGLEANPDQPGAAMLPEAAAANRPIFYAGDGSMRSLSEIRTLFAAKLAEGGKIPNVKALPETRWHVRSGSVTGAAAGGGRPPLQMMDIEPMPRKLSMDFAASAYRRLAAMGGDA